MEARFWKAGPADLSHQTHDVSPAEARGHPIICIFFTLTALAARSGEGLQLHLPHHCDGCIKVRITGHGADGGLLSVLTPEIGVSRVYLLQSWMKSREHK